MFENLKDLLGDAYHDDMTAEEVNSFFAGKNFGDLSTGLYVNKDKYDRELQALNTKLAEKENALNAKLTDDEKAMKARDDDRKEIERLTALLKANTISSNKNLAMSSTSSILSVLGLKGDNSEYTKFIENIVSDDSEKTSTVAKYVSKIVNDAYEKGKKDALKDKMGEFGKSKKQDGDAGSDDDLGTRLAKRNANLNAKEKIDYFKR